MKTKHLVSHNTTFNHFNAVEVMKHRLFQRWGIYYQYYYINTPKLCRLISAVLFISETNDTLVQYGITPQNLGEKPLFATK